MKQSKKHVPQISEWLLKNLNLIIGLGIGFSLTLLTIISLLIWISDRPLPGVVLANMRVGLANRQYILTQLNQRLDQFDKLTLLYDQQVWNITLSDINYFPQLDLSIQKAIDYQKNWQAWDQLPSLFISGYHLPLEYQHSDTKLDFQLQQIADQLYIPAIEPEVLIVAITDNQPENNYKIRINPGTQGQQVDLALLRQQIHQALISLNSHPINIPVELVDLRINSTIQKQMFDVAQTLLDKQLILIGEQQEFVWDGNQLAVFVAPYGYQTSKIDNQLKQIAQESNIPMQNAEFKFNQQANRVEEFKPEVLGRSLDIDKNLPQIVNQLEFLSQQATSSAQIDLTYRPEYPEIQVADINQLGIEELIGQGTSTYKGSIVNRIHNLTLAASRLNGTLIKPNQEFSFNEQVGDVNASTGYKKAYIIRSGQTILDDGGGVCQVSTTMFRAALDAGLPIIRRQAHAYRVYYYEQNSKPGLDATVYAPLVDLKFINDTHGHILIETQIDPDNYQLTFNLYGTSDGRDSTISNQRLWGVTPPPEDLYVDDPSLPVGQIKQIEYPAWGAKAAFDWTVIREGEILQERTFYSNYQPWGAVYLKGIDSQI